MTGEDIILDTARRMGLCESGNVDGIFEYRNNLPQYSEELSSKDGYLANLAIGQGRILLSPIGTCVMFSTAVTGYCRDPHIISRVTGETGFVGGNKNSIKENRVLDPLTVRLLRKMMISCVEEGLGKGARPSEGKAGGKTATAQSGMIENGNEILNCWFCGFYPSSSPKYSVSVLSCGTKNSDNAKKVFREICDHLEKNQHNG